MRKPGIPPLNNKRWTCARANELCFKCVYMHSQRQWRSSSAACCSECISDSFRCDQLCLEPGLLHSPSSPPFAGQWGWEREREHKRVREQPWPPALESETMATCLRVTAGDRNKHKHRNRPFCHWDRPAEAWESGGGTVSLSIALSPFSICPNMTKKWSTCWLYSVVSQGSQGEKLRAPQSRREWDRDILGYNDSLFWLIYLTQEFRSFIPRLRVYSHATSSCESLLWHSGALSSMQTSWFSAGIILNMITFFMCLTFAN